MVDRRLASPVPDSAGGVKSQRRAADSGGVLALSDGRAAGGGGPFASIPARPAPPGELRRRHVRLLPAVCDQQLVWRRNSGLFSGSWICQHLSPGGGGNRAAVFLLSSGVLQRHLFLRAGRRTAR